MHSSVDVANRLLNEAQRNGDTFTPMQLLKLVFLCHGWMLGLYGRSLIREEVQAWKYGPVIPDLYQKVRKFRSNAVVPPLPSARNAVFSEREDRLISQVHNKYGKFDGLALSHMTHAPGSPWDATWRESSWNPVISNDLIENYYAGIKKRAAARSSG